MFIMVIFYFSLMFIVFDVKFEEGRDIRGSCLEVVILGLVFEE